MIDWTQIDRARSADWLRLAETLMQRGIAAIQTAERAGLRALQDDLMEFVGAATLACPVEVLASINTSSRQVASALLALDVQALGERSARLDAAGAKISVVANATRAEAARIRLVEVRRALDGLIDVAGEVRDLRDKLSTIPKKDVPAKLDAVLDLLGRLEQRARAALA